VEATGPKPQRTAQTRSSLSQFPNTLPQNTTIQWIFSLVTCFTAPSSGAFPSMINANNAS